MEDEPTAAPLVACKGRCSTTCPRPSGRAAHRRTSATAAPPPATSPASPTASSTTGRAPVWSSPPSARPPARAPSGCTASATSWSCKVVKKLLDAGVSLPNIRTAIATLRDRGVDDLAEITLISDGTTVYECTSTDEMVDLLQGGQAVFAIAVGRQVRDVEGTLAQLPASGAARPPPPSASAPPATSCQPPPAPHQPPERRRRHDRVPRRRTGGRLGSALPTTPRGRVPGQPARGAEGAILPDPTSQATGPRGSGNSGKRAPRRPHRRCKPRVARGASSQVP